MKKSSVILLFAFVALCGCRQSDPTTLLAGEFPGRQSVRIINEKAGIDTVVALAGGAFSITLPYVPASLTGISVVDSVKNEFIADGTSLKATEEGEGKIAILSETPEKSANTAFTKFLVWENSVESRVEEISTNEQWDALMTEVKDSCIAAALAFPDSYLAYNAVVDGLNLGVFDDETLDKVYAEMTHEFDKTPEIQKSKQRLRDRKATAEGSMFVDMVIDQDPVHRGSNVARLSDYVGKGKYVLVDFWASWCGPCRAAIPVIGEIYDKYKGDDFDVVSIAVSDRIPNTVKAAKELNIRWNQIINAEHVAADIYGFEFIPYLILFGPDGTILKRDIKIDQLEAEVSKALGR